MKSGLRRLECGSLLPLLPVASLLAMSPDW